MISFVSKEEAVSLIESSERVFIHGGAATPESLVNALTARHTELTNVELIHLHTEGSAGYAKPEYGKSFHVNVFFVGGNIRPYINNPNVQYIPVFLSEIPAFE
jgi:acyl-CoA hydrolase